MKKILKNRLFIFILGGIIFSSIGVYAANYYAKNIQYKEDLSVEQALNDVYEKIDNQPKYIIRNGVLQDYEFIATSDINSVNWGGASIAPIVSNVSSDFTISQQDKSAGTFYFKDKIDLSKYKLLEVDLIVNLINMANGQITMGLFKEIENGFREKGLKVFYVQNTNFVSNTAIVHYTIDLSDLNESAYLGISTFCNLTTKIKNVILS